VQAAVEVRKQVNQLDNLTTSKAVDALLNAETVALFGNKHLEVREGGYGKQECSKRASAASWGMAGGGQRRVVLCRVQETFGPNGSFAGSCTSGSLYGFVQCSVETHDTLLELVLASPACTASSTWWTVCSLCLVPQGTMSCTCGL
jgi:ABC-type transport system involved in Fe-S cluster assembly fused permease/ATPase subunit